MKEIIVILIMLVIYVIPVFGSLGEGSYVVPATVGIIFGA
jgi:hypothetical protein